MQTGAITSYIDVAQLALYAFWIFFAGLIFYLRREDKREGYPLVSDRLGPQLIEGVPPMPRAKVFHLADGSTRLAPREEAPEVPNLIPAAVWPGAPFQPSGDPLLDAVGPAAYAQRADVPDRTFDDGLPKIVPLRAAGEYFLATEDADPRGMTVLGTDGVVAGHVVDAWIDRTETIVRYLEVELDPALGVGRVLLPMPFVELNRRLGEIHVAALLGSNFAEVPRLRNPNQVTLREEDRISAYYGGGMLYATPARLGPVL